MSSADRHFLQRALTLARRGFGRTSPNPMVGAVVVAKGRVIGEGWHHRAGEPHAEINALRAAGAKASNATLYVTLEPCCTHGRTPPCTDAIRAAGISRVVVSALDPNPAHAGRGLTRLRQAGLTVEQGILAEPATLLNEAFNHWIVQRTPFVTVKAAMSLDGKIATRTGQSKWITGPLARARGMRLRAGADDILVGVNTIIKDNASLTLRHPGFAGKPWRRLVLDPRARTPLHSQIISDDSAHSTIIVVTETAPAQRVKRLSQQANVLVAPIHQGKIDLAWLMRKLGEQEVTQLLVEGGGVTNAAFFSAGLVQRVAFFYAPMVIGGRTSAKGVAGAGFPSAAQSSTLVNARLTRLGQDLFLTARVNPPAI